MNSYEIILQGYHNGQPTYRTQETVQAVGFHEACNTAWRHAAIRFRGYGYDVISVRKLEN